jgi:hypothetical protein
MDSDYFDALSKTSPLKSEFSEEENVTNITIVEKGINNISYM